MALDTFLLETLQRAQHYIYLRNAGIEYVDTNDMPIVPDTDEYGDDIVTDDTLPIEGALEVMRDDLICERYDVTDATITPDDGVRTAAIAVIGQYA
jgi:hypothetical protein